MIFEWILVLIIVRISDSSLLFAVWILVDDLGDAVGLAGNLRDLCGYLLEHADNEVEMLIGGQSLAEQDRRVSRRIGSIGEGVRQKTIVTVGPHQLVQQVAEFVVVAQHEDAVTQLPGFFCQPAAEQSPPVLLIVGQVIKIDAGQRGGILQAANRRDGRVYIE